MLKKLKLAGKVKVKNVAIETTSLDLIKVKNFQQISLTKRKKLTNKGKPACGEAGRHLFERIHDKNPCMELMEQLDAIDKKREKLKSP
ncbi:hypothetical protein KAS42_03215 [bacterium]|nr:hypothetical protein [bacterium]